MALPIPHPFESGFGRAWPSRAWCDSHVVLAVSGGADSVAMLRAALAIKERCGGNGRLYVAHLNHGLRGEESDADAEWLKMLCGKLGSPLEIGKTDVSAIADRQGDGWEAAARMARYDFLRHTAEKLGARFVTVAHTADDQVETVLHRILRGAGIAGLRGIPAARPLSASVSIVRPLLTMRRSEVLDYLTAIDQDFRSDVSNADPRWTRNRLRHELLPALREYFNADVDAALLRLAAQAAESQDLIAGLAAKLADQCVTHEFAPGQGADDARRTFCVRIDVRQLADQPALIVREVCKAAWHEADWPLQAMRFDQWQQLAEIVRCEPALTPLNLPGDVRTRREGNTLILHKGGLP
ncbi:MAG: tRNA lysidine(34) synthetase TilS [Planctomycetes bacterium]|nr:tRNA lysidine(34) synthetase TilS [Planctomycetota bacterium]